jgi:ABC-type Zn uptake system ZnuABC Zn-binding protein ZnuA
MDTTNNNKGRHNPKVKLTGNSYIDKNDINSVILVLIIYAHSYEPSTKDMINLADSDFFSIQVWGLKDLLKKQQKLWKKRMYKF